VFVLNSSNAFNMQFIFLSFSLFLFSFLFFSFSFLPRSRQLLR
jgi:hypothetical protein